MSGNLRDERHRSFLKGGEEEPACGERSECDRSEGKRASVAEDGGGVGREVIRRDW